MLGDGFAKERLIAKVTFNTFLKVRKLDMQKSGEAFLRRYCKCESCEVDHT
jgi:hypothetical protein